MSPKIAAMYALSERGYQVYVTLSNVDSMAIEDSRGVFYKVLIRTATPTDRAPVFTLSLQYQTELYVQNFGYFLVVEPDSLKLWLIPVDEAPKNTKCIRLGEKYEKYVVKIQEDVKDLSAKMLQQEVKKRVCGESYKIQQEDLESLLSTED